ncbi:vegetative cell wall protein gp1-like [Rhododendron vialii]|uniref:vegetative cell wall protein gp1-like n=1 Tax=Rhododendron vialii TaxID=182163 RepID=UPI00265DD50C|nr:vegetative cell wall protein gp1-like [Rhododendron vialii]
MVLPKSLARFIAMSTASSSISSNLNNFKIPIPFHSSAKTKAFSLLKMPQARQTPKPISISAHWVPNHPPDPPEFPSPRQIDPPSMLLEVLAPPNIPDFDPIPPADPPPVSPGPNPGPDFPGPPMPSPPTPDAPRPPIPSPLGPDVYPPNRPEIGPPLPIQPDIPPPF